MAGLLPISTPTPVAEPSFAWTRTVFGGNNNGLPASFSSNSKTMFCPYSSNIKAFSVETGEKLQTIKAHTMTVTGLFINPHNAFQLISTSLDGTLKIWETEDRVQLQTHTIERPIVNCIMSPKHSGQMFLIAKKALPPKVDPSVQPSPSSESRKPLPAPTTSFLSQPHGSGTRPPKQSKFTLYFYDLVSGSLQPLYGVGTYVEGSLCVSPRGDMLAFIGDENVVLVDFATQVTKRHKVKKQAPTCLAFHPQEACLAVGDISGSITLFWPQKAGKANAISSTLHWHAHAVKALTFSRDGAYLLSGGSEAVVVIWQLLTGIRQYLPRVGDKVVAISITPDQGYYALTLEDNSVRLIDVLSLTINKSIKGLIYAGGAPPTGLVLDPLHLRIALNAKPGSLQFYRPSDDTFCSEFEVASIPPATKEAPRNPVLVDHVCFSFDGKWMVTSERLKYPYGSLETQGILKFWRFSHKLNDFGLNTRISEPHKNVLTSLRYHPTKDIVVTTSKDGKFKTWNNFVEKEGHTYWIARSVGVFRDYPATASSFSTDGSLLAVGFQNNVTLWDLKSHTILTSFSDIHLSESISTLAFLAQGSPYLVAHTRSRVTVWNLLSCKPWWSVELAVDAFTSDPKSTRFAVATRDSTGVRFLLMFEPFSPRPVASWISSCKVLSMTFLPNKERESSLIYLTHQRELVRLGTPLEEAEALPTSAFPAVTSQVPSIPFKVLQNKPGLSAAEAVITSASTLHSTPVRMEQIFDAPSHVLPPISKLYNSFMDLLMIKAPSIAEAEVVVDKMEIEGEDGKDKKSADTQQPAPAPSAPFSTTSLGDVDFWTRRKFEKGETAAVNALTERMKVYFSNCTTTNINTNVRKDSSTPTTPQTPKAKSITNHSFQNGTGPHPPPSS